MRWKEVITEGVNKYKPMFASIYGGKVPQDVLDRISDIERQFRREDRIIWALRWVRFDILRRLINQQENEYGGFADKKLSEQLKKALRDLLPQGLDEEQAEEEFSIFNRFEDTGFDHYLSLPIPKIKGYVFNRELPSEIEDIYADLEQEWQENLNRTVRPRMDDEILIDFKNGWAWFLLNRNECSEEGEAMGHCGNGGNPKSGERILSLRERVHEDMWSPHATFIIDKDGFLGEMKGRNNEKPVEKYHQMIITLLKNPIVFGIKGGGYMAENNFTLDDLTHEEYKELIALKPGFNSIYTLLQRDDIENATKLVKAYLSAYDWSHEKILPEKKEIIIQSWDEPEQFCDTYRDAKSMKYVYDEIHRLLSDTANGDAAYYAFHEETFVTLASTVMIPLLEFKAELDLQIINGKICLTISYHAFDTVIDEVTGEYREEYETLDAMREGGDSSDWATEHLADARLSDLEEHTGDAIIAAVGGKLKKEYLQVIADMILVDYAGVGSYTTKDPRQMRFDFGNEDDRN